MQTPRIINLASDCISYDRSTCNRVGFFSFQCVIHPTKYAFICFSLCHIFLLIFCYVFIHVLQVTSLALGYGCLNASEIIMGDLSNIHQSYPQQHTNYVHDSIQRFASIHVTHGQEISMLYMWLAEIAHTNTSFDNNNYRIIHIYTIKIISAQLNFHCLVFIYNFLYFFSLVESQI